MARFIIEVNDCAVEINPALCGPTERMVLCDLLREAQELTPTPSPSKPGPKLSPPEQERLKPARAGA